MLESWKAARRRTLGNDAESLFAALDGPRTTSVRLNPAKRSPPLGPPVPWCATGHYLEHRPRFTLDPVFHAGQYYVQEASAMMLGQAVGATGFVGQNILALDLCAAPGGKSTHLLDLLGPGSLVVCNELDHRRLRSLQQNLWKWGTGRSMVTSASSGRIASLLDHFDLVLVDAPCSGEGLMRRDDEARRQWTPDLVRACSATQRTLLADAWACLRPGGALIYATCTFAPEEDEYQLQWAIAHLGAEPVQIMHDPAWGAVEQGHGLLCLPHRLQGEGAYFGVLRKPGSLAGRSIPEGPTCIHTLDGETHLIKAHHRVLLDEIHASIPARSMGTPLFTAGDRIPHPAAALDPHAMQIMISDQGASRSELDHDAALRYLRGEALRDRDARGWTVMTFNDLGLGWAKGVAGRWNNHYPAAWRIRMHPRDD
ncbi:MAG: RNA methyltransferase RsmF [Flavobacteriales bacterium]|nr:RNA methyltransferase RsmF [Flavobacteriales bacterium]MCB9193657.1 RNA methyltransferase RsmF [Flavobacteriales bacterium]